MNTKIWRFSGLCFCCFLNTDLCIVNIRHVDKKGRFVVWIGMLYYYALKSCKKIHELICRDFNNFKFRCRSKRSCRKFPMLPKHLWGKRYAVVTRNLERFDFGKQCWLMWSSTARNQYCIWLQKPIDWVNNPPSLFSHCVCLCVCVFRPGRGKRNSCLEEQIIFSLAWVLHFSWAVDVFLYLT